MKDVVSIPHSLKNFHGLRNIISGMNASLHNYLFWMTKSNLTPEKRFQLFKSDFIVWTFQSLPLSQEATAAEEAMRPNPVWTLRAQKPKRQKRSWSETPRQELRETKAVVCCWVKVLMNKSRCIHQVTHNYKVNIGWEFTNCKQHCIKSLYTRSVSWREWNRVGLQSMNPRRLLSHGVSNSCLIIVLIKNSWCV